MATHLHWTLLEGITINEMKAKNVYKAVYSVGNYGLNTGATINPMTAINDYGYSHPAFGTVSSFYGVRNPPPYNNPLYANHWGLDYGVLTRR